MSPPEILPAPSHSNPWCWRLLLACVILGATALHLAWLTHDCPLELAPDEAHYWDWSRHLDWSYYSKGPLVAFLIRAGCIVAGPMAEQLTGNAMIAVRLPALICGILLLVSLYVLTVQVYHDERLAVGVVLLGMTMPLITAVSSLMTIDAPYTCCWGWALVLAHQAVFRRSTWAWPLAGLVIGLGILAKYTMVVFVPSLGLFLLTSREHRGLLLRPGFWVMSVVAALSCLPILVWNAQHDWISAMHVMRLAGLLKNGAQENAGRIEWLGPLIYVAGQFGLLLGFWFIAWACAMIAHRPWQEPDAGCRYLWWLSAPMFAMFLAFSPKTGGGELNWPVTAYLSGIVLTAGWIRRQLKSSNVAYRRLSATCLAAACGLGILVSLLVHFTDRAYPLLARLSEQIAPGQPFIVRRVDPTCRLRGWQTLAAEVDRLRAELRARGIEPVLAASAWTFPGELGFYCTGHPTVYSVGLVMHDRHSQYDYWHPNPIADWEQFRGRTFIIVGGYTPSAQNGFESIEKSLLVVHSVKGLPVSSWPVTIAHGFRGFPSLPAGIKN